MTFPGFPWPYEPRTHLWNLFFIHGLFVLQDHTGSDLSDPRGRSPHYCSHIKRSHLTLTPHWPLVLFPSALQRCTYRLALTKLTFTPKNTARWTREGEGHSSGRRGSSCYAFQHNTITRAIFPTGALRPVWPRPPSMMSIAWLVLANSSGCFREIICGIHIVLSGESSTEQVDKH